MYTLLLKNKVLIILWLMVICYILYFSIFTILRSQNLYAHYFDLGIMHQTVYNTYEAIKTGDFTRFLEMTDPHGVEQVKRMAIHNDLILAPIAFLYFIYSGPETLLVLQSLILGLGAFAVYGIACEVMKKQKSKRIIALFFSFAYLMYTPMQRANIFEFHAVTLATSFLLFMFYFWLKKKYWFCIFFLCLSLLTKEQVGLTTLFFGFYVILHEKVIQRIKIVNVKNIKNLFLTSKQIWFGIVVMGISIFWFLLSMKVIAPLARGGNDHFALKYYSDLGDSPEYIFHIDTFRYFFFLLGPLGFLSLFSPLLLFIALPEFAINLLSNSWDMRNIVFHYTSVIQPFVFISSIYGLNHIQNFLSKKKKVYPLKSFLICLFVICLLFSYFKSPLPYSKEADLYPLLNSNPVKQEVLRWSSLLKDKEVKISTTGKLASHFTSRRYYYHFPNGYEQADYVLIQLSELQNYFDPKVDIMGVYKRLQKDTAFKIIYQSNLIEVYKKI